MVLNVVGSSPTSHPLKSSVLQSSFFMPNLQISLVFGQYVCILYLIVMARFYKLEGEDFEMYL